MGLFGSSHPSIDVNEANRRALAGEVVLVDVREQNEWQGGHAPMAKHVPLGSLSAKLPELAKSGKPVAFICLSGGRSGKACGTASKAGLSVINVKGGMGAWTSAGLPVAR